MARAWASAMPGRMPSASAAGSAAVTIIRRPSLAAVIKGLSGDGAPGLRRSRSVGQVGNQTATTRRIERLHDPASALTRIDPGLLTEVDPLTLVLPF